MFKRQLLINFAQENWSEYLAKTWKILEKHLQLIAVVVKLEAINLSLQKLHFFTSDFLEIFQSFQNISLSELLWIEASEIACVQLSFLATN